MKLDTQRITRTIGHQTLVAKRNSPHIFFFAGLAGVVGSTVLACRATLKLEKELDAIKTDVDTVKQSKDLVKDTDGAFSNSDYAKDLTSVYVRSSVKVVRLYAPSVTLGALSIACLSGSHIQLTRRNAALSATLGMLGRSFEEYRDRIRKELGEERELEIYRNIEDLEIKDENGKKQLVKAKSDVPFGHSPFARVFDETSPYWHKSVEMNRAVLNIIQEQMNNRLTARGHVFLNEVYEALGLSHTQQGQFVGWVRHSEKGDNYIDFCMYDTVNTPDSRRPYDRSIWLDFNVDPGTITDILEK